MGLQILHQLVEAFVKLRDIDASTFVNVNWSFIFASYFLIRDPVLVARLKDEILMLMGEG